MPVILPITFDRFLAVVAPLKHRKLRGSAVLEGAMVTLVFGPSLAMTLIRVVTFYLGLSKVGSILLP